MISRRYDQVQRFTVNDVKARGFVRTYAIIYVTTESYKMQVMYPRICAAMSAVCVGDDGDDVLRQVASAFQQGNMARVYNDVKKQLEHFLELQERVLLRIQESCAAPRGTPPVRTPTPSEARPISRLSREVFAKLKSGQKLPPESDMVKDVQNCWQEMCLVETDGMTPDDLANAIRDMTLIASSIHRRLKGISIFRCSDE